MAGRSARGTFRAAWRASETEAAIRDALTAGDTAKALNLSLAAIQSEAAKVRRQRPGDAVLIDAGLAGLLLGTAAQLHAHKPPRPPGSRRPLADDLLTTFAGALAQAHKGGEA